MSRAFDRRVVLRAGLAACATLALPPARACEFFVSTLRITHPWTRATEPGADTAVLCMTFDQVTQTDRLIEVRTPIARGVELVAEGRARPLDLLIPVGSEMVLDESGTHLRLVGLDMQLQTGRTYPLMLVFEQGGQVRSDLSVDYDRFN